MLQASAQDASQRGVNMSTLLEWGEQGVADPGDNASSHLPRFSPHSILAFVLPLPLLFTYFPSHLTVGDENEPGVISDVFARVGGPDLNDTSVDVMVRKFTARFHLATFTAPRSQGKLCRPCKRGSM